ncbi:MAG: glycosyltransferase [Candidatus Eremiobacteraeota bacterium]|nr:glycosyltransferase [Candidatus Eremiobacteraeota bacterium]
MSPLRVGFFTECYRPIVNGVVASVEALTQGLRSAGHDVYCFAPRAPGYVERDGPTFRMPSWRLPVRTAYRLTIPLVSRRNLNGVIKRLSIIHTHSPFVTGWMGVRYARRFNIPLVYTYHTQLEKYAHYVPFDAQTTRWAAVSLTRLYANAADAVVVPTATMHRRLRELGVTVRIEVVPSAIDVRAFAAGQRREDLRSSFGVGERDRLVLFVSRLAAEKNASLALRAMACTSDPTLHLVVVGDGPARADLERQAANLGLLDRVTFAGELPPAVLPDVYASSDVFLFTSTSETQGLVLAEAMAAGCTVVAVDTPQTRDVLKGGGVLVADLPQAVYAAVRRVTGESNDALKLQARLAAQSFDIALQSSRIIDLYQDLRKPERLLAG